MFNSARLKLTAWYVLILMSVSVLFSVAFYEVSTREIQQLIDRIEYDEQRADAIIFKRPHLPPHILTLEELYGAKSRLGLRLMVINIAILLVAGGASYFLAAKTLRPIKEMVDEQNQFITDASHELRTPIATLRAEMEASLLEKKITDLEARSLIISNLEELSTIQELSNRLLLLAQSPSLKTSKESEKLAVTESLKLATKKVKALAKKKKIKILEEFSKDAQNYFILAAKDEVTEVFVILLDNAIKYSPTQSVITTSVTATKSKIQITISDQGIGISQKDLPHIFKRFYRADTSRSQADGYGLGLAIAKKIVERHQGSIQAKSSSDKGTTFLIQFPRSAA